MIKSYFVSAFIQLHDQKVVVSMQLVGAYNPGMWLVRRMAPVALVALAGLFVPASATVNGNLTQVTSSGATSSQTTPAISGSLVVWNNSTVMTNGGTNHDIYWEDLV